MGIGTLSVKKELLWKVKSTKMSYYGHVVSRHNSLEKGNDTRLYIGQ